MAGPRCYGGGRSQQHVSCRLSKTNQEHAMTEQSAPAATAFDHNSTLVLALELSGKGWQVGAVLPGVARRPRRSVAPRDVAGLLTQIERWKAEAQRAGRPVLRTVLAYEAGRDRFWIARYLLAHGIEVQIMHPRASRWNGGGGGPKPIGSISTCCCARCWRGCGVSRGYARWCASRARPRRTCGGRSGSANGWSASGSRWRTASRTCCACTGSPASGRV